MFIVYDKCMIFVLQFIYKMVTYVIHWKFILKKLYYYFLHLLLIILLNI